MHTSLLPTYANLCKVILAFIDKGICVSVPGHLFEVYVTSGPEMEPLAGTFYDRVPKDTVIVIYGDMGKSEQLPLVAEDDDTSSPGNTQYFKVFTI